ncbi:MAG TPA: MurR/RpiR family transcriptional regulator [Chloroflexi bacterium]|nr:MurR/RpiR family transcriptional regulator [Chloroflexota bacterium]
MFQERIRENYDQLTPGFRKLGDFITTHTLDAAFLTATELSRRVGVDPATVVRFAQELGYSGYRELSREIKRYVRDQVTATYRMAAESGTLAELLHALVDNSNQNMQHFVSTGLSLVAEAVNMLSEASKIWIVGEYSDYAIAEFLAKSLNNLGLNTETIHPSMRETAGAVAKMQEGELLFALANSGPSVDTGYAVKLAKEKNIRTICLTGAGVVLAAREADLTITAPVSTPANVPSFGTIMQVITLIWEALAKQLADQADPVMQATQENMGKILNLRAETPEYEVAPQETWTGYTK